MDDPLIVEDVPLNLDTSFFGSSEKYLYLMYPRLPISHQFYVSMRVMLVLESEDMLFILRADFAKIRCSTGQLAVQLPYALTDGTARGVS